MRSRVVRPFAKKHASLLVAALLFAILVMSTSAILGALFSGIYTDEELHMLDFRGRRWASDVTRQHFGVYGLSFQLLSHLVAVVFDVEALGTVSVSAAGFAVRHVTTAVLLILTAITSGFVTWIISRQRLLALWSVLALLSVPVFFGHGFFNTKDIPVAFGFTLFTLGAVSYLFNYSFSLPRGLASFSEWVPFFCVAAGIWMAVGTRLGMVLPLVAISVWIIVLLTFLGRFVFDRCGAQILASRKRFVVSCVTGLLAVAATNPCLISPVNSECRWGLELVPRILSASREFPWGHQSFLAGQLVPGEDPPFWYLPIAIWAGAPFLLFILAVIGFVFYWENPESIPPLSHNFSRLVRAIVGLAISSPVLIQLVLGPAVVIVLRGTIYDAQRQHLYVYPAMAVLSALGLFVVWSVVKNLCGVMPARLFTFTIAVLSVIVPAAEALRLFPYSYVYVNPIASMRGFSDNWETDYWATSLREALTHVPVGSYFEVAQSSWLVVPYIQERSLQPQVNDRELKYVISWHRVGFGSSAPPEGCVLVKVISRKLRGENLPMSYVSKCPLQYDSGAIWNYKDMLKQEPYVAK